MRYLVLATDYDGTLAHHGTLDAPTIAAIERLRASGRRVLMVTGRELEDLQRACERLDLFDLVVAENGALLYWPAEQREQVLGERPPEAFVSALHARGVAPLSVGRSIVATWEPHQAAVLDAIRELGLELQVIFNKGAVMVLPSGVNKASGLQAALETLELSAHNVVGIGDAENDHAFLSLCECGVAVANALPMLKERADWTTAAERGAGVAELIDALLQDDLAAFEPRLERHQIVLGSHSNAEQERLSPYATNLLLCGSSGSGKSTLATALLDQLVERGYQCCIIDPEGDYDSYPHATNLGDAAHAPTSDAVLALLANPAQNVVVNLLGIALEQRPAIFDQLLARLLELRARTGRPHWIVVDEAHHMLHAQRAASGLLLPKHPYGMLYITVHPDLMSPVVLRSVDHVAVVGEAPNVAIGAFSQAVDAVPPDPLPLQLEGGQVLFWRRAAAREPIVLNAARPVSEHHRHVRKYAEGDMGGDSFFFRGPEGKLNLRAHNVTTFVQLADGVDDATWLFHLAQGDYTHWFRTAVKDDELANEAAQIAADDRLDARASRDSMRVAIERRYTAPAH
jgi:hypothetical protein